MCELKAEIGGGNYTVCVFASTVTVGLSLVGIFAYVLSCGLGIKLRRQTSWKKHDCHYFIDGNPFITIMYNFKTLQSANPSCLLLYSDNERG